MANKSKIAKFLENLDTHSSLIGLRSNGNPDVKSLVGAFISVCSLIAAILLSRDVFEEYLYSRSPIITIGSAFNSVSDPNHTTSVNFSEQSLFLSLSFYTPNLLNPTYSFDDNDYNKTQYYNEFTLQCTNCETDKLLQKMGTCNPRDFDNIHIDSYPRSK